MGRRWQRVCGLFRRPRRHAARPFPPGRHRGGEAADGSRHALRLEPRARSALGRAGVRADALRREGALHGVGHRGLAHGDPAGARPHRQGQDRALRRPLPRLARQRRGGRLFALRRHDDAGRAAGRGRSQHPDADRGRRCDRQADRDARRHRLRDVRAVGRVVGPGAAAAGLRAGRARRHGEEGRRHADGRGHHRLPLVVGRCAEGAGRHARPLHPGQDRGRRPAGRRRRRQARHPRPHRSRRDGRERPGEDRPSRHLQRQSACRPRRR